MNKDTRILIVDDFEMIRMMMRRCLAELGFQNVDEGTDGNDALALLEASVISGTPYGVIFSDLNMPNLGGMELLAACRSNPKYNPIPFVMITAEAEREYVVKALQQGATDYIVKPFSGETLRKKIEKVTQRLKKTAA